MAARTSSRICCLSWSSGHKHRCTGRSPGCLWQHESDGDDYASLWQPGKAEHPGGERGAGLGHLLWHPSQEFWALLAPDTPGTRHLSMSPAGGRRTCCVTVTSVGVVRYLCWNCKAVPTQENALPCREQWAMTAQHWLRKQEISELFPTGRCLSIVNCWSLPFPFHLQTSISLFLFQTLSQSSSCPCFSWTSPAPSSWSPWHQACQPLSSPLSILLWGAVRETPPPHASLGQSHFPRLRVKTFSSCGEAGA